MKTETKQKQTKNQEDEIWIETWNKHNTASFGYHISPLVRVKAVWQSVVFLWTGSVKDLNLKFQLWHSQLDEIPQPGGNGFPHVKHEGFDWSNNSVQQTFINGFLYLGPFNRTWGWTWGKYKDKGVEKRSMKYIPNGKKDRVKHYNRENKARSSRSTEESSITKANVHL